jgi:pimeloyl-ACP methyl ester carboxylesterase
MTDEIFEVVGPDGATRRGVLSRPVADDRRGLGLVLLPCGLKNRIGPNRFYVELARLLAGAGYWVLRVDPLGLGESDGSVEAGTIHQIWRTIQNGRFVDDAVLVAETLRTRYPLRHLVVGGICGGALTAQLATARRPDLFNGVVSMNTAVNLDLDDDAAVPVGAGQARHNLISYVRKAASLQAWARILKGESDLSGIRGTLGRIVRPRAAASNENPEFMPSFRALEQQRVPHLLLFAGNDGRWPEFQDVTLPHLRRARRGAGFEIHVVPDANHEFHLPEWKQDVTGRLLEWLHRRFPAAPPSVDAPSDPNAPRGVIPVSPHSA